MTPFDLSETLNSIQILVDTREKPTAKAEARYKQFGAPHQRKKLSFGDYSAVFTLPNGEELSLENVVSIERKESIDELAMCYCQERPRFVREFDRAKEANAKVYLLIESATWENAYNGKYRSKMNSTAFVASLLAWCARYNCIPLFCKPETSGKLIKDVLYREGKEILERDY